MSVYLMYVSVLCRYFTFSIKYALGVFLFMFDSENDLNITLCHDVCVMCNKDEAGFGVDYTLNWLFTTTSVSDQLIS